MRWALLPQSDNNWISTDQPTSQSSCSSHSFLFHYATVILSFSLLNTPYIPRYGALLRLYICSSSNWIFVPRSLMSQSPEELTGLEDPLPLWLIYLTTNLMLAILAAAELIFSSLGSLHSAAWVFSKDGGWLLPEWAIQEKESHTKAMPFMIWRSQNTASTTFCILDHLNHPTLKGRGIRFHLLMGKVSENLHYVSKPPH